MHPPAPAPPDRRRTVFNLCRATSLIAVVMAAIWLISLVVTQSDDVLAEYSSGGEAFLTVVVLGAYVALGATLAVQSEGVLRDVGGPEARRSWGIVIALFALFCADALLSCIGALGLSALAEEAEFLYGRGSSAESALSTAAGWGLFLSVVVIGAAVVALVTMIQFSGLRRAAGVGPVGVQPTPAPAAPSPAPAPAPNPVSAPAPTPPAPAPEPVAAPEPAPAPPVPSEPTVDITGAIAQLKELSELLDKGHITRDEYDRLKSAVPGIGGPAPAEAPEAPEPAEPPSDDDPEPEAETEPGGQARTPAPEARRGLLDELDD